MDVTATVVGMIGTVGGTDESGTDASALQARMVNKAILVINIL